MGQKVVKVFCREAQAKELFAQVNEDFSTGAARKAHTFASLVMPIMINLSHLHYAYGDGGAFLTVTARLDIGGLALPAVRTRPFPHPSTPHGHSNSIAYACLGGCRTHL
jgi:ATP-binding cassette subfamily B protein